MAERCQTADGCQNVSIIKTRNFQFENIGNFVSKFLQFYLALLGVTLSDSDSIFA